MIDRERLYDAFGELIYLVAMADGVIQPEETAALEEIIRKHPWAEEIRWSFDYEIQKNNPPEYVYKKVINVFEQNGPDPEYVYLLEVLETVAKASAGIDPNEAALLNRFTQDLSQRLKVDIARINSGEASPAQD